MKCNFPEFTDFDKEIWKKELNDFVPEKIVDVHSHLWNEKSAEAGVTPESALRLNVSCEDLHRFSNILFLDRQMGYLLLPTPLHGIDRTGHNIWMAEEAAASRKDLFFVKAGMLVHPEDSSEYIMEHVRKYNVKALKPYRVFAKDPADARIKDFITEEQLEVANTLGLAVVLHLSKKNGPADPENMDDLEKYTMRFPKIKWILAHCARAFNSVHLEESIHRYASMENLWVDTSAVNDTYSHYLLLKYFDRKRILFGSDNIVAGAFRGKYITFGNGWKAYSGGEDLEHCDGRCTFVIYEQLRCQKQAFQMAAVTEKEKEAIFAGNAEKLFS